MIYRLSNSDKKPWPTAYDSPRLVLERAGYHADCINEPMTIWCQPRAGGRLRRCRRIWPYTVDHFVAGHYRRKSEKIR